MRDGPLIECRYGEARPTVLGDSTVTPVARSVVVRWPGGGAVWSAPSEVLVERAGRTERIPVEDLSGRIVWALRIGAAGLIAAWLVGNRRRRSND